MPRRTVTPPRAARRAPAPVDFVVLVYRMPPAPTAGRVAVWRQLKKLGAIYLQQSVCVFPNTPDVRDDLAPLLARIIASAGEYHLLPVGRLTSEERRKLLSEFMDQTARHYEEIVENCEVNFQKEVEFETFRKNFTYEEAEEIRAEYEKITLWLERVRRRDWFNAPNRRKAEEWVHRCRRLLEEFEAKVYRQQATKDDTRLSRKAVARAPRRAKPKAARAARR